MVVWGILAGCVLSVVFVILNNFWVNAKFERDLVKRRAARVANALTPVRVPIAMIAQDMFPLFSQLPLEAGVQIQIVGNDGFYASKKNKNGELLLDGIRKWMKKGVSVTYVLVDSCGDVSLDGSEKLNTLQNEFPNLFRMVSIKLADLPSGVASATSELCNTHPTIVQGNGLRAMWLERNHPCGSKYAFNVDFFSPESLQNTKYLSEFEKFRSQVAKLIDSKAMVA